MMLPEVARRLAEFHLVEALPRRWRHVQGVGFRAEALSSRFEDGPLLANAAWLQDLGYASELAISRFHPLDGARALCQQVGDERLCGLIAYHSAATFEASALGLADELRS